MIDTHCHLYSSEFNKDLKGMMQRAESVGVKGFYMPAIDSSTLNVMLEVEKKYPNLAISMMGLHPCSVNNSYLNELNLVEEWLNKRPFAGIGEIGLDFYWDKTFIKEQYLAFRKQIEWALHFRRPIVIHSRNATAETIQVIQEYAAQGLTGIFHCFGGSLEEAQQIIDCGFCLGIGGVITYKNSGLADVVTQLDLKHLVLETDAPYLAPAPYRGKRNESSYLVKIAEKVAEAKNISLQTVVEATTSNALRIFSF